MLYQIVIKLLKTDGDSFYPAKRLLKKQSFTLTCKSNQHPIKQRHTWDESQDRAQKTCRLQVDRSRAEPHALPQILNELILDSFLIVSISSVSYQA